MLYLLALCNGAEPPLLGSSQCSTECRHRKSLERQWGTPEEEDQGYSVQNDCIEQVSITC